MEIDPGERKWLRGRKVGRKRIGWRGGRSEGQWRGGEGLPSYTCLYICSLIYPSPIRGPGIHTVCACVEKTMAISQNPGNLHNYVLHITSSLVPRLSMGGLYNFLFMWQSAGRKRPLLLQKEAVDFWLGVFTSAKPRAC